MRGTSRCLISLSLACIEPAASIFVDDTVPLIGR
jgi:hypothetical protein